MSSAPRPGAGWVPWFGLPSGEGGGHTPRQQALEQIADGRAKIHAALSARGRDPTQFGIRVMPEPVIGPLGYDLAATVAKASDYIAAGATHLEFAPGLYCRDLSELDGALAAILSLRA